MNEPAPKQLDRLVNAAIFFTGHTRYCGAAKLFRLLYALDVAHFQQTGATVTGEQYRAWSFGPAPDFLFDNLTRYGFPFRHVLQGRSDPSIDFHGFCFQPSEPFSRDNFTPRQEDLLVAVAAKYASDHYGDMVLEDNDAYLRVWGHGRGKGELIPLEWTLSERTPHANMIAERHREQEMMADARRMLMQSLGHAP